MPPRLLSRPKRSAFSATRVTPVVTALIAAGLWPLGAQAQLSGAAAAPAPVDAATGLMLAPQLQEHPLPAGSAAAKFVTGDRTEGTAEQNVTVTGHGEVRTDRTVIKADRLHYSADTDIADAYGNVHLVNNGNTFVGPEAHLQVGATEGYLLSPTYHFNLTNGSGQAQRIDVIDPEQSTAEQGTYTACACATDPAWYVRFTRFRMDTGDNTGAASNAVLYFENVPIFASPYLTFPLNDERRSGFLPPTIGLNSTTGVDVTVPYYFNIAPNRDLTLSPRIMTHRGVQIAGTYRYLAPTYSGTTTVEYVPYDSITKTDRWAIFAQHAQNLGNGFGAYYNFNRVSDNTYPEDLSQSNNLMIVGTQLLFQEEGGFTYSNGPWSALARIQHWQTLPPSIAPYGREPQLNVKYQKYDVGGFDFGAEADATRFRTTETDMAEGQRVYLNPYVSYPIMRPGYFFVPKAQYHLAAYDLSALGSEENTNQPYARHSSIAVPTLSVDSGLVFERPVRIFGRNMIQTLEPRLYYVYTPYRDQSRIPVFDTVTSDFGLAEIFTDNTFVGNDRIADANRLTAALTTRFIDEGSGDERARFLVARQYYFRNQTVTMPLEPTEQATHSDYIFGAAFKLGAGFASETALQYNTENAELVRSNIGFAWSPGERRVLNVAYRYTRATTALSDQPINQAVLSAQWPLTRQLYAVTRVNYDINGHKLVDGLLGLQYDADCWALGVALQRYANGINASGSYASGTRVLAQLQLKGFSKIDNGLEAQFRASVPGYSSLPGGPPPQSRFSNYE
jgi:LPS-assembly protein